MKAFSLIVAGVSTLMILSELVCGLWIRAQGAVPDSVDFHVKLGVGTVIAVLVALSLLGIVVARQ